MCPSPRLGLPPVCNLLFCLRLLNVLEVIAPFKHFNKLREFVQMKLPPGFPVKLGEEAESTEIRSCRCECKRQLPAFPPPPQTSRFSPPSRPPSPFRSFATTSSTSPCSSFPATIKKTPADSPTFNLVFAGQGKKKTKSPTTITEHLPFVGPRGKAWKSLTSLHTEPLFWFLKVHLQIGSSRRSQPLRPEELGLRTADVILIKGNVFNL